jgi:8-oxo-dGTP pyrophosphatase MutT (NUDIX family)
MELRDVFTRDGAFTGKVIEKGSKIGPGEYLYHAHIILKNADGRYLLQRRSLKARYFPGQWDVTGGGVQHGETGAEAAAREAKEELGVAVDPADCFFAGRQVEDWDGQNYGLISDIYGARIDVDPGKLTLSAREVAGAKLVPFAEFVGTVLYNKDVNYRRMLERIEAALL